MGYWLSYKESAAGISSKRTRWVTDWIGSVEANNWFVTGRRCFAQFLGRLNFVSRVLTWVSLSLHHFTHSMRFFRRGRWLASRSWSSSHYSTSGNSLQSRRAYIVCCRTGERHGKLSAQMPSAVFDRGTFQDVSYEGACQPRCVHAAAAKFAVSPLRPRRERKKKGSKKKKKGSKKNCTPSKFPASMNFRSLEHLSFWHVTMQQSTEKLQPLDIDATHSSASGKSALALANGGWHCHGAEVS